MTPFSGTHLIFLVCAFGFLALSSWAVSKLPRRWQNVMFVLGALLCAGGIFFRYGMGLRTDGTLTLDILAQQMLQVCNFNFILVLLMLIPRFELARQYSVYFSMFAASTTLFALSGSWKNLNWYDLTVLNSLLNHIFAIAVPLWMVAARRLKPRKEYAWKVTIGVFVYFTAVALISTLLIKYGVITVDQSWSFIYKTDKIPVFEFLYKLIPYPYFYLLPMAPVLAGFFLLLARAFKNYKVEEY